jgi:hypothetical protein
MLNSRYFLATAVSVLIAAVVLSTGATSQKGRSFSNRQPLSVIAADDPAEVFSTAVQADQAQSTEVIAADPDPDSLKTTSTFYTIRSDLRRCASPLCGGFFVKRVNLPVTRCADGQNKPECYIAEIDWNGPVEVDAGLAILRGQIIARNYSKFGNLGALRVTESWQAVNNNRPEGMFYHVRDTGVRCITFPCPTYHEAKLNSTASQDIAGVDLVKVESASLSGPAGVIVAGEHLPMTGPGGRMLQLKATQVYLKVGKTANLKPCVRGGCSNQVCSDHPVITTCEWRPEYACYQKATCERQADGNCGFTRTKELTSCLASK